MTCRLQADPVVRRSGSGQRDAATARIHDLRLIDGVVHGQNTTGALVGRNMGFIEHIEVDYVDLHGQTEVGGVVGSKKF